MPPRRIAFIAIAAFLTTTISTYFLSFRGIHKFPLVLSHSLPAMAQAQNTRKALADRRLRQGIEQYQKNQFQTAVESWRQALSFYRELHEQEGQGATLSNLGFAYYKLGNYSKAIEYHQQWLEIAREMKDRPNEAAALENLGLAYKALGNYAKLIKYQQQALEIQRAIGDRQREWSSLTRLGNAYAELGDYDKALEYYKKILASAQESDNRQWQGIAFSSLGAYHLVLGEYSKAIDYNKKSLAMLQEVGDRKMKAFILNNLGVAYHALGDRTKAIDYYQRSAEIGQQIGDKHIEGNALGGLGFVYENLGNYPKAIEYHKKSVELGQLSGDRRDEAFALNNLGHTLLVSGNLVEAEKQLRIAIKVLDSLRAELEDIYKASLFDTQVLTYNLLQQVLVAQKKYEAALEISEWGRARAFVDLLVTRLSSKTNTQGKEAIEQISAQPLTFKQIQQIARSQNATLVEYSIIPDEFIAQGKLRGQELELFIWIVQPTGKVGFRRVDLKNPLRQQQTSLEALVRSSRESIGVRGRRAEKFEDSGSAIQIVPINGSSQEERLQELHKLLIEPIADLLPKNLNARVIFFPHESLFLVPFPALQDASKKYLIEKYTILTAPAIQVLELTQRQREKVRKVALHDVLVLGNPTMPSVASKPGELPQPLPSLPGAEQEAKAIAALLKTKPLMHDEATKTAFLQRVSKAKLIHLATHGLLDDVKGLEAPGKIALAPSARDNGLLTADEIQELKLNPELVILSACDTGGGRITGDGVIGLSRSLIIAGAPSVVVSLWSVPDAPTAELMTEFYRNWLARKLDKAQSLRQAMLTTMKNHPHPKDWAAFTLIGEAK